MGNERVSGSSSSSSSRKGKKNNQEKPKQPQRGLGVAQLEKIRLHGQIGCGAYHPPLHAPYPSNFNNVRPFFFSLKNCHCFSLRSSEFQYWEVLFIDPGQHAGRSKGANTLFITTIFIIFFLLLFIYFILSFIWLPTQHCGMSSFCLFLQPIPIDFTLLQAHYSFICTHMFNLFVFGFLSMSEHLPHICS